METMHSKLIRLQTALLTLALLFTVLIPVSAYAEGENTAAQGTANSETISDPNTFNAWELTQAYNNATTGRIWADKTVEEEQIDLKGQDPIEVPQGADFLVALSALSSHASTTTTDTKPLDVVLVLDASGSMDDPMGNGDRTKRIDALKDAVYAFIDSTAKKNKEITDENKKIQLSIVKFSGNEKKTTGNDQYRKNGYQYNYSQIVQELTVCEDAAVNTLKSNVEAIKPAGATRADNGMKRAQAALASARENAKQVVIFFTDGEPNNSSGFDDDIASAAIATAKSLKDAGTVVYTVGIFSGADPNANVNDYGTSKANKYMQSVSSNYPKATYTYTEGSMWNPGKENWSFGDPAASANYYLAASNADGLNKVFNSIFESMTKNLAGPTEVVGDDPKNSGYVTFDDPLGDYMQVKGFEAVAFAGGVYKKTKITTSTDENGKTVDTYTFTDKCTGTASNAYPNTADLSHILITVTHGSGSAGDTVQVKIPASMLPLRYYQVTTDKDNNSTLAVTDTQPISVIYSVGLKDDARSQITSGKITDDALASYVAANTEDGKVSFYSNKFDPTKKTADGEKTIGSTTATFTPATSNSFYYHTEDTLLYTKTGEGESAQYKPAKEVLPNQTYYYQLNYLHLTPESNHTETVPKTDYVPVSIATQKEIDSCITKKDDGNCYIKKDIKKGSLPSAIDSQLGDKKDNTTGTAKRRIDFQWDLDANKGVLYLGNNGKLTMNATGSLKVTKKIEAADGLHPKADAEFTMKFELAGANVATDAEYKYTVTDTDETQTIKSGENFKLKDGQTAEIVGLPAGSTYTITEETPPTGYTSNITNDGTGEVTAGTAKEVTVTNTYKPNPIEVTPDNADYPFDGAKILQGRNWYNSDKFGFKLEAVTDGAPLPDGEQADDGKRYTPHQLFGTEGAPAEKPVEFNFGSVTFDKPGTYVYNITEHIPTDKIPGVSYDSSFYRVTVTIEDDGSGQLKMQNSDIEQINGANTNEKPTTATFTNIFENATETFVIEAKKLYKDENGTMDLTYGQFQFKLEPAKVNESNTELSNTTNIPMPNGATGNVASAVNNAYGTITFEPITYSLDHRDNGQTYYYLLTEDSTNKQNNITYSTEKYLIKAEVSTNTEPLTVTTTYYRDNNGTWDRVNANQVTFTNTFTGETKATLGVSKSISGRAWKEGDEFTFTLTAPDGTPMPDEDGKTVKVTKGETPVNFGEITYKKAGEYKYTISENDTDILGMTKAADVTATVKVALNADTNNLEATVEYSNPVTVNGETKAKFENTYNAKPYTPKAKELFQVEKELKNREWNGTDTFYFTLSRDGNAPLPTSTTASVDRLNTTATIGGDQQLEFNAAGKYTYFISENSGSIPGVTYDKTRYKVVVTVEDNGNGELKGTTQYYKSNDNGEFPEGVIDAETNNVAKFTNIYHADDVTVTLTATKVLNVQVGTRTLQPGEFSFTLCEKTGDTVATTPTLTAKNDANGNVTFELPAFTSAVGKKTYVISEVNGDLGGIKYDPRKYEVTFNVTDNGEGKLVASTPRLYAERRNRWRRTVCKHLHGNGGR